MFKKLSDLKESNNYSTIIHQKTAAYELNSGLWPVGPS